VSEATSVEAAVARLIRRLENFAVLSEGDKHALREVAGSARTLRAHETLMCETDMPPSVSVIVSGFACRYKTLADGRRQIVAYLLPGDICDIRVILLRQMDHAIATLSPTTVVHMPVGAMLALMDRSPRVNRALWWSTLVDEAISREWLVNVGQRTALERMAHLFCEMHARFHAIGLTDGTRLELPVTQSELADTLALSTVHINRTLQELRRQGLVSMNGKMLEIHDLAALQAVAVFDGAYLHLDVQRKLLPGIRA
jgi:CRP-like cAMP-binding protein